ncbi:hypothetical protein QG37_00860 [Candidozyma auris]|nr:hypothetical protein QG37_00860 [[Candida] auris]
MNSGKWGKKSHLVKIRRNSFSKRINIPFSGHFGPLFAAIRAGDKTPIFLQKSVILSFQKLQFKNSPVII